MLVDWSSGLDDEFFGEDEEQEEVATPHWVGTSASADAWFACGGYFAPEIFALAPLIDIIVAGSERRLRPTLCFVPQPRRCPVWINHANRRHEHKLMSWGKKAALPKKIAELIRADYCLHAWARLVAHPEIEFDLEGRMVGDRDAAFKQFLAELDAVWQNAEAQESSADQLGVVPADSEKHQKTLRLVKDNMNRLRGLGPADQERFLVALGEHFGEDPQSCHTSEDAQVEKSRKDAGVLTAVCPCKYALTTGKSASCSLACSLDYDGLTVGRSRAAALCHCAPRPAAACRQGAVTWGSTL